MAVNVTYKTFWSDLYRDIMDQMEGIMEFIWKNYQLNTTNVVLLSIISSVLSFVIYWYISKWRMIRLSKNIPGPCGLPIIGNALDFIGSSSDIFNKLYASSFHYENVAKYWIGSRLLIFLMEPSDIELVLSSHVHIDKSREYKFFRPWLGNGLLISTGSKWRNHRKLIAPTFHLNVLKTFINIFNSNSKLVVERLKLEKGKVFDCHDYMSEATVEILLETAMGVSKKTQDQSCYEYAMAVMKMCDILHLRHTKIWLRSEFIFNMSTYSGIQEKLLGIIHGLTRKVIKRKKEDFIANGVFANNSKNNHLNGKNIIQREIEETIKGMSFGQASGLKDDLDVEDNDIGEKKRYAFLDLMLDASRSGVDISDEEIKEQVDTIMFEGHDTTAAASSFFLTLMGIHGDVQKRVHSELDSIFGDSDRDVTFADTLEMKYLERCLMETMRLYPPVPIIAREFKEDLKLASGDYVIPSGATVIVATFKLHRNSKIYPNPDKFDPDNFLPERTSNRHYYSFIPFSAGPRSCVGRKYAMLKLKILLATIMRNFRVVSELSEEDFKLQADIILKREEGFPIRLQPRFAKSHENKFMR